MTRHAAWLGMLAASVITVGCGRSDTAITEAVKEKLATDEIVNAASIDVATKDQVVTLSGTVDTQATRERAVTLARQTNRVVDVVDRVAVSQPSPTTGGWPPGPGTRHEGYERERGMMSDAGIEAAVRARLTSDSMVGTLNIAVDVENGTVELSGTLRSEEEQERAITLARQTRGVRRVEDDLDVGR